MAASRILSNWSGDVDQKHPYGRPAQIGFDEWPGGNSNNLKALHVFFYIDGAANVQCDDGMQPAWPNGTGGYQGCEGRPGGNYYTFDTYFTAEMDDLRQSPSTRRVKFFLGSYQLGHYDYTNSSQGLNAPFYESEIADSNGDGRTTGETMAQLLTNGLKYYGYYPSMYWYNGSGWTQFTGQITANQDQFDLPGTYTEEQYNPYCSSGFGQSAGEYNTNDYADMMYDTHCPTFGQSIPPNP